LTAQKPDRNKAKFVQVARCYLPTPMKYDEFTELSKNWMKVDIVNSVNRDFTQAGLLIDEVYSPGDGYFEWTYYFKNKAAFESWIETVQKKECFCEEKLYSGIEYKFEYYDLATA
jgi:hypothetical protein